MAVRINAIPVGGFRHGGLVVGKAWATVDALDDKQRAALRDFHGRFIRIHPEDVTKLGELGFAFDGARNPLVDSTPTTTEPATPPATGSDAKKSNTKNDAAKGVEKKER